MKQRKSSKSKTRQTSTVGTKTAGVKSTKKQVSRNATPVRGTQATKQRKMANQSMDSTLRRPPSHDQSSSMLIDPAAEQSELSIKPTKLQRLDLASLAAASVQEEAKTKAKRNSSSARGISPAQTDCMLSASIYNGDRPIPQPPKMKPSTLGSLNFSTLRSNDSKASQSFKLARLALDESLEKTIEKMEKRGSAERSAKKFSPYRTNSTYGAKDKALSIVNASQTVAAPDLKTRQFTTARARPLSARSSTPSVPKPGSKKPKNRSKERKVVINRPPVAAPTKARPPQPGTKTRKLSTKATNQRSQPNISITDCSSSDVTTLTHSASVPHELKQSRPASNRSERSKDSHSKQQKQAKTAATSNVPLINYSMQSSKLLHEPNAASSSRLFGSSSHRLNATTTAASEHDNNSIVNIVMEQAAMKNTTMQLSHRPKITENQIDGDISTFRLEPEIQSDKQRLQGGATMPLKSDLERRVELDAAASRESNVAATERALLERNFVTFSQKGVEDIMRAHGGASKEALGRRELEAVQYSESRLMQKTLAALQKQAQLRQQKSKLAAMFHKSRLVASVVQQWRSLKLMLRQETQIRHNQLFKVVPLFAKAKAYKGVLEAFKELKKLTMSEAAYDLYRLKQLKLCWQEGLLGYTLSQQRKKSVLNDTQELYDKKLVAKALVCLAEHRRGTQEKAMMTEMAKSFFQEHRGTVLSRFAYDTLVSHAITRKQTQNARTQHRFTLLVKAFLSLRDYQVMRVKRNGQIKLVGSLYRCGLLARFFNHLKTNVTGSQLHRAEALKTLHQRSQRRTFDKLKKFAKRQERYEVILGVKQAKTDAKTLANVFRAILNFSEKQIQIAQSKKMIEKVVRQRGKKIHMREWAALAKKKRALRKCQDISYGIDRQRTLTKFITLWFQKLHLKLKKKHLQKLQKQFCDTRQKTKFMSIWLQKHEQYLELEEKDKTITSMQERQTLKKCLNALKESAKKQALKQRKDKAAEMEYVWWLGKRAFASLRSYFNRQQASKEISNMVVSDRKLTQKRKIYQAIQLYSCFYGQRRKADAAVTSEIQSLKKSKVLRAWSHLYSKRIGARLLAQSVETCAKRLSLQQISRVCTLQKENVAYFKEHRPSILLQWCFISFRRHARRRQYERAMLEKLERERLKKIFNKWHGRYQGEQAKIDLFNKTLICIKNSIAKRAFKSFTLHALQGRLKKRADIHRYFSILQKGLHSLRDRVQRRYRSNEQFGVLCDKERQVNLSICLQKWRKRYQRRMATKTALQSNRATQLSKVYRALKGFQERQIGKKQQVLALEKGLDQIRAKYGLLRLRKITTELAVTRESSHEARLYHQQYLFQRVSKFWFSHFKRNHAIFAKLKRFKALKARENKHKTLRLWTIACERTLGRVKAASHTNQLLNKLEKSFYLRQWRSEAQFLTKLAEAAKKFNSKQRQARVSHALHHINQVAQTLAFERTKKEQTTAYANLKRLKKAFGELYRYKEERMKVADWNVHADAFTNHNLLIKGFQGLFTVHYKQQKLRQAANIFRKRQMAVFGPGILQKWQNRLIQRQKVQDQKLTAEEFDSMRLGKRSLRALHANVLEGHHKHALMGKAAAFNRHLLIDRGVRGLLLNLCERREKLERHTAAIDQVQAVQSTDLMRRVFLALIDNRRDEQSKSRLAFAHYVLKLQSTALHGLQGQAKRQRQQGRVAEIVSGRAEYSLSARMWQAMREQVVLGQAVRTAESNYEQKLLIRCMKGLKQQCERQGKLKVASQIRSVTAAVKAFESLKLHVAASRAKHSLQLKAMVHHAHALQHKALKAFDKTLMLKLLAREVQRKHLRSLALRTLTNWEDQLQLKLWRKDAFQLCRIVMTRHALKKWKQLNELESKEEQACLFRKVKLVARGWQGFRVATYRAQCSKYVQQKQSKGDLERNFKAWLSLLQPEQVKGQILVKKLVDVSRLRDYFEQIKAFTQVEAQLQERASGLAEKVKKREKASALDHWVKAANKARAVAAFCSFYDCMESQDGIAETSEVSNKRDSLAHIGMKLRVQRAFSCLKDNAIEQQHEQLQLYSVIRFFSQRPPQNLLRMQKTFLLLSKDNSAQEQPRMCSATLAKYIIEKWRIALPRLAHSKQLFRKAALHFKAKMLRKVFLGMAGFSKQVRQQSCLSVIVSQTHDENIVKAVFNALRERAETKSYQKRVIEAFSRRYREATQTTVMQAWRHYSARKANLKYLGEALSVQHHCRLAHRYLAEMQQKALRSATNHTIVQSFTTQRNRLLCTIVISVLQNFAKVQNKRRREELLVDSFRKGTLLKKGMLSLKLQRSQRLSKHRYSRLFTLFTSWKTLTRENNLLKKYLAECNYKQKAMVNQSHTIDASSSQKKRNRQMGHFGGAAAAGGDSQEFTAGHELVFQAVGQLSFADSVMVDYKTIEHAAVGQHFTRQQQQNQGAIAFQPNQSSMVMQQSTIQHGSDHQLGLHDLLGEDGNAMIDSRDNNFLFGCKPSAANFKRTSLQRRFAGDTSSDDEEASFSRY